MRRIIVHLLRGNAARAHEDITKDLTSKFDTFPLHDRITPHLTIKRWFELDDKGMKALYLCLDNFIQSQNQSDYVLSGFGSFGKEVIYVDVVPSKETLSTVHDLMNKLRDIQGLTFDKFDEIEDDLHATVAMTALKPFDYEQIWSYLKAGVQPNFNMKFDNLAVLKRTEDRWVTERVWEIK
ncbi:MAG: 2'-5' RNA ligase family protein [bacterium]